MISLHADKRREKTRTDYTCWVASGSTAHSILNIICILVTWILMIFNHRMGWWDVTFRSMNGRRHHHSALQVLILAGWHLSAGSDHVIADEKTIGNPPLRLSSRSDSMSHSAPASNQQHSWKPKALINLIPIQSRVADRRSLKIDETINKNWQKQTITNTKWYSSEQRLDKIKRYWKT